MRARRSNRTSAKAFWRAYRRHPDGNEILIRKEIADRAFESATCTGCGACVAACKNASAVLFVGAKVMALALMPQSLAACTTRAEKMVARRAIEGFGAWSNPGSCATECPVGIKLENIAALSCEYLVAKAAWPSYLGAYAAFQVC